VSGLIYLGNGTHLLGLSVDDQQQVGESNESNNKARVTVEVRNCGQTQPGRAPLRAPVLPQ
jgi:subtilase family serine protease